MEVITYCFLPSSFASEPAVSLKCDCMCCFLLPARVYWDKEQVKEAGMPHRSCVCLRSTSQMNDAGPCSSLWGLLMNTEQPESKAWYWSLLPLCLSGLFFSTECIFLVHRRRTLPPWDHSYYNSFTIEQPITVCKTLDPSGASQTSFERARWLGLLASNSLVSSCI